MKILQDMHIHTHLSLCSRDREQNPTAIIKWAAENGIKTICFTDHLWDNSMPGASIWLRLNSLKRLEKIRAQIPDDRLGVNVMVGCETEFAGGGTIGISPAVADKMDFILLPFDHFHNKRICPKNIKTSEQVADLWITRFDEALKIDLPWHKTAFAHVNIILGFSHQLSMILSILLDEYRDKLKRLFSRCAEQGAKIEVNTSLCGSSLWENHLDLHKDMFGLAKESGCLFTFGSDAHHPGGLKTVLKMPEIMEQLGLDEKHIYDPI